MITFTDESRSLLMLRRSRAIWDIEEILRTILGDHFPREGCTDVDAISVLFHNNIFDDINL